jgi:predicted transcriptional regulator
VSTAETEIRKVTVEMEPDLKRRLVLVAAREGKTQKEIIIGLVTAYVTRKEAEGG